jgi:hypothetical protein
MINLAQSKYCTALLRQSRLELTTTRWYRWYRYPFGVLEPSVNLSLRDWSLLNKGDATIKRRKWPEKQLEMEREEVEMERDGGFLYCGTRNLPLTHWDLVHRPSLHQYLAGALAGLWPAQALLSNHPIHHNSKCTRETLTIFIMH